MHTVGVLNIARVLNTVLTNYLDIGCFNLKNVICRKTRWPMHIEAKRQIESPNDILVYYIKGRIQHNILYCTHK